LRAASLPQGIIQRDIHVAIFYIHLLEQLYIMQDIAFGGLGNASSQMRRHWLACPSRKRDLEEIGYLHLSA